MKVFFELVALYFFIAVIYILTGIVGSMFVPTLGGRRFILDPSELQALITGASLIGIVVAVFSRFFAIHFSLAPSKALYFQGILVLAAGLLTFSVPEAWNILEVAVRVGRSMVEIGIIRSVLLVTFVIGLATEGILLIPEKLASIELFNERKQLLDLAPQYILRGDIENAAREIIEEEETIMGRISDFKWITGAGYEDLATMIADRLKENKIGEVRIITTPHIYNRWKRDERLNVLTRVSKRVDRIGNLKIVLVNKRVVLEALSMPEEVGAANTGIKHSIPERVHELVWVFDSWYNSLQ
jgi:hypothetical protein